ncbi:MAG TPA: alpha/beta hydrolase [Longimicrobium sp.]
MTPAGLPPAAVSASVRAADGIRIHYLTWAAARPRAVLLLSHGLGEHSGRYAPFAAALVERGITMAALDHRGHGRSSGQRGHVDRFSRFAEDFEAFRSAVAKKLPAGLPVFVLGHSLGGLIVIRWLQAHRETGVRGVILSAPLLGVAIKAPAWKLAISGFLSRWLPKLPFTSGVHPEKLSTDEAYVRSYHDDPLVHSRVTPRLYTELQAATVAAFAECSVLRDPPTLVLIPGDDQIVDSAAVTRFAESLPGDVTIRHYPEMRHEVLNEADRARPIGDVVGWVEGALTPPTPLSR